jgi:hypothetical protein
MRKLLTHFTLTNFAQNIVVLYVLLCSQFEVFRFSEIYLQTASKVLNIYSTDFGFVNVHTILACDFEMMYAKPFSMPLFVPKFLRALGLDRTRPTLCSSEINRIFQS